MSKNNFPRFILASAVVCLFLVGDSMATFSIVAVDSTTGAVGSAGASCIAGAQIIHDVIEGIGAINTQALYNATNQARADSLMREGLTPDSIISWLVNNDAQAIPQRRQYGAVTLAGPGSSAGFTGTMTIDWKGHLTGFGYSIQGNILLGPEVLDTIEFAFLNTSGPLEDRLMAALEAANIPGADTRCLSCNKPAISAFIKVVRIGDGSTPYLYEVVNSTDCPYNPIPMLRAQYDAWRIQQWADPDSSDVVLTPAYLPIGSTDSAEVVITPLNNLGHPPTTGVTEVTVTHTGAGTFSAVIDNGIGTYSVKITAPATPGTDTVTASVDAGSQLIVLNQKPVLVYYLAGDCNGNGLVNIADVVYLLAYIFSAGPAPVPLAAGDANCNGLVNIADVVYLIAYIFSSGPPPCI